MNVDAHERPRPIHDVFHSQIFRRHIRDLGVDFEAVGPGMKTKDTINVITAGTRSATMARTVTVTVSGRKGYPRLGSWREKGRLFVFLMPVLNPAPAPARALKEMSD